MAIKKIIIATRTSPLALWQANWVKSQLLSNHNHLEITLNPIVTQADKTSKPIASIGGKGIFVKELQKALLDDSADIAVHCVKDLSVEPIPGLSLCAICPREDPRDALISNHHKDLQSLPPKASIGTSSPRRASLLSSIRPDIIINPIRGNLETRLKQLDDNKFDAIMLAACGLYRLGLGHRITQLLDAHTFIPAIGQGALGIECKSTNTDVQQIISSLNHQPSQFCIAAERAVNQRLCGSCQSAIGAYAEHIDKDHIILRCAIGDANGHLIHSTISGPADNAQHIGITAANELIAQGARAML